VGGYALIVQMLAGGGALVAADENWLGGIRASGAFPREREWLDKVVSAWSGDGTAAGSANVGALIDARPDTVLVGGNTSTLTQSECDRLVAAGIDVVVMPPIGGIFVADKDIATAVRVVGELLKSNLGTQYYAPDMAAEYIRQHDAAINNTLNANGGYAPLVTVETSSFSTIIAQGSTPYGTQTTYLNPNNVLSTMYIDAWSRCTPTSGYTQRLFAYESGAAPVEPVDLSDGLALSILPRPNERAFFSLFTYYLQCAGVGTSAGAANFLESNTNATRAVSTYGGVGWTGVYTDAGCLLSADFATIDIDTSHPVNMFTPLVRATTHGLRLGDAGYPAVLARDETIARQFVNSGNKTYGLYNMRQPFQAFVVPSGIAGSWVDGNVESFLISPWAYCMFKQGKDLTAASSYINDFYSAFYRCGAAGIVSGYGDEGIFQAYGPSP
jgi:hypothetical protein